MFWNALNAIASTISMIAFVFTALYVRGQLKSLEKDRFLTVTNDLFTLFQSDDFAQYPRSRVNPAGRKFRHKPSTPANGGLRRAPASSAALA